MLRKILKHIEKYGGLHLCDYKTREQMHYNELSDYIFIISIHDACVREKIVLFPSGIRSALDSLPSTAGKCISDLTDAELEHSFIAESLHDKCTYRVSFENHLFTSKIDIIFEDIIKWSSRYATEWNSLGEDYFYGRSVDTPQNDSRAQACYEQALRIDPTYSSASYSLGWLYDKQRYRHFTFGTSFPYKQKAREYYEHAEKHGSYEAARELLKIDSPDFAKPLYSLKIGNEYYVRANYLRAYICYATALYYDPNCWHALHNIGLLYEDGLGTIKKNLHEARKYFEKVYVITGSKECIERVERKLLEQSFQSKQSIKRVERKLLEQAFQSKQSLDAVDGDGSTALHRLAKFKCFKDYARLRFLGANPAISDALQKKPGEYLTSEENNKINRLQKSVTFFFKNFYQSAPEAIVTAMAAQNASMDEQQIRTILDELYKIEELKPLLDLAKLAVLGRHKMSGHPSTKDPCYDSDNDDTNESTRDPLRILIDPKHDRVEYLVGFGKDGCGGKKALGVYVHEQANSVYLAAKQPVKFDRDRLVIYGEKGLFMHELGHFLTKEIFNNGCKPYKNDDAVNRNVFSKISDDMQAKSNTLISLFMHVFASDVDGKPLYQKSSYHDEIIVRVSQLIADNPITGIQILEAREPTLLKYYRDVYLKAVREHIVFLEQKAFGDWSPETFKPKQIYSL